MRSSLRGLTLKGCLRPLLLHHVSQLVRQKSCSLSRSGRVLSCAEHDIPAQREGTSVDAASELRRAGVRVDSYRRQVTPEPRLEESARRLGERRPATGESPYPGRDTTADLSGSGLSRWKRRRSREGGGWAFLHCLVGHAVCLMLERVVDRSDDELRLDERGWL